MLIGTGLHLIKIDNDGILTLQKGEAFKATHPNENRVLKWQKRGFFSIFVVSSYKF